MTQSAYNHRQAQTVLAAAHDYAAAGWPIFPTHGVHGGRCTCGGICASPGKHPRIKGGLTEATTKHGDVERWFRRWPTANVAIRTGKASGLVVVDVDPAHGGLASLRELIRNNEPLPPTMTVATGSDGLHFYFQHPGGEIHNSAGTRLGPGLDVRGDGGYVIAPPSTHISGKPYYWSNDITLEAMPDWLHEMVREPERVQRTEPPPVVNKGSWAETALRSELNSVSHAPEGQRNYTLNRAAFNLGQIVAGGTLERSATSAALVEAGMSSGLSERECLATVASGMNAGLALPRGPAPRRSSLARSPEYPATPEIAIHF